jgi:hypothetical protein
MNDGSINVWLLVGLLAAGLVVFFALGALDDGGAPLRWSISGQFERMVESCREEHPHWGEGVCERIVRGDVWFGMTGEMLRASVGKPVLVRQPRKEDPLYEEWTYFSDTHGHEIFHLYDDVLTELTAVKGCASCPSPPPRRVGRTP